MTEAIVMLACAGIIFAAAERVRRAIDRSDRRLGERDRWL